MLLVDSTIDTVYYRLKLQFYDHNILLTQRASKLRQCIESLNSRIIVSPLKDIPIDDARGILRSSKSCNNVTGISYAL